MQIADPVISHLHYYWQQNCKPTLQERKGETRYVVTLLNQWGKIEEENGIYFIESFMIPNAAYENTWFFPRGLKKKYSPAYMMVWTTKEQSERDIW